MKLFERCNLPSFFPLGRGVHRGIARGQRRIKPRLFLVLFSGNGSPQLTPSLLFHTWDNFEGGSLRKKMFQSNCQNVPLLSTPKPENLLSFNYPTDIYCIPNRCQAQCQDSKLNPCPPEDSFLFSLPSILSTSLTLNTSFIIGFQFCIPY